MYTEPKFAIDAKLIFTEEQVKSETAGRDEKAERGSVDYFLQDKGFWSEKNSNGRK